ncbi:MAG: hypothetical protein MZW92_34270 [Comamonadaceae bacterium]|nr:hypothetical protein [Comamonadaceae bacterium]
MLARGCWSEVERFDADGGLACGRGRRRRGARVRRRAAAARSVGRAAPAAGRAAQPHATRWRRSPPRATPACRRRLAIDGAGGASSGVKRRLEVRGTCRRRHRLRRLRAPPDGDRDDASPGCGGASAARASSRCSSRARTR